MHPCHGSLEPLHRGMAKRYVDKARLCTQSTAVGAMMMMREGHHADKRGDQALGVFEDKTFIRHARIVSAHWGTTFM